MLDNLRWIADYFAKCHHAPQAFTAQVGSTNADHAIWGRAEDMTIARPSADLTPSAPGDKFHIHSYSRPHLAEIQTLCITFTGHKD